VTLNGAMCWHAPCKKSRPADCSEPLPSNLKPECCTQVAHMRGEVSTLARLIQSIHSLV
jgi:hypothetical protein